MKFSVEQVLPADADQATLVGRAWVPGRNAGPSPVLVAEAEAWDLSRVVPTVSELLNLQDPVKVALDAVKSGWAKPLGAIADLIANSHADRRDAKKPYLLAPCDLQALRACGVTFVASMLERVIEEQAKGDPAGAEGIRRSIGAEIGGQIESVKPGSPEAMRVKDSLIKRDIWSQYLEVGIGPDAEVFTKSQPMSAVGLGAEIGIRADSTWNNPEPEVVLAINRAGPGSGRDARQRRQPARFRRPQRAAARQGEGQQRQLRDRPLHPPVRRTLRDRRSAPHPHPHRSPRPGGLPAVGREPLGQHQPRPAGSGGAGGESDTPVSGRSDAASSEPSSRRPRTAVETGKGLHPQGRRFVVTDPRGFPGHAGEPGQSLRQRSRRGLTA